MRIREYRTVWMLVAALSAISIGAGCPQGAGTGLFNDPLDTILPHGDPTGQGDTPTDAGIEPQTGGADQTADPSALPDDGDADDPGDTPLTSDPDDPPDTDDPAVDEPAFSIDPSSLGTYLLAFHACDRDAADCDDPSNHEVYLATGEDGVNWTVVDGWEPYTGSVPDVIERDDMLYIYTPNRVVTVDLSTGDVSMPVDVALDSNGELEAGFVDPSPILDDEGRIVVFFVPGDVSGAIGTCEDGVTTCTATVRSMTEVEGSDGTEFTLDDDARATVDIDTTTDIKTSTDPDIFFDGSQYVLYISHGPSMTVWTSPTLRGTYTKVSTLTDGFITYATGGVGAGHFDDATSQYWTYAHVDSSGVFVIRRGTHADFTAQLADGDMTQILTGESIGRSANTDVASPGFLMRQ